MRPYRVFALVGFVACAAFVAAAPARAAVSFVQGASGTSGAATSISKALDAPVAAGDTLAVAVDVGSNAVSVTGVSATCASGGLSLVGVTSTPYYGFAMAYGGVTAAGSCTVTATLSGSATSKIAVTEIAGVNASGALDTWSEKFAGFTSAPVTSGTSTAAFAGDFVFGATANSAGSVTSTPGAGFSMRVAIGGFNDEDGTAPAAGPVAAWFAPNGGSYWLTGMMAFRSASSPPSVTFSSSATSTLFWNVSGASSIAIAPGSFSTTTAVGSLVVSPSSTTVYTLTATNAYGATTAQATVVANVQPPSVPTDLRAFAISPSQVNLMWAVSSGTFGVAGYHVRRNGAVIATANSVVNGTAWFDDTAVPGPGTYAYSVDAYDPSGRSSAASPTQTVTVGGAGADGVIEASRRIDWSQAGIPGGIPNRTAVCATIKASSYGNGASDASADIQAALNACPANGVVALTAGTFLVRSSIAIPGNVTLRGAGADKTVLNSMVTTGAPILLGTLSGGPRFTPASQLIPVMGNANKDATSITVANAAGISVGEYLVISRLNTGDVTIGGDEGPCTWCDTGQSTDGSRSEGQILEVRSVNGTTIGVSPLFTDYDIRLSDWQPNKAYGLATYVNPSAQPAHYYEQTYNNASFPYTCTSGATAPAFPTDGSSVADGTCVWHDMGLGTSTQPLVTAFTMTHGAGVEDLQVYANNTHTGGDYSNFKMNACAYCWIEGVEGNYADGDHVNVSWTFGGMIADSYFSNAFRHTSGQYDSDVNLADKVTGMVVENDIFDRLHVANVMLEWGAAGNVVAYNYSTGAYDTTWYDANMALDSGHGAEPQYNLIEGNVFNMIGDNDDIHGSANHATYFRNWAVGFTKTCEPAIGGVRGATVTCAPLGGPTNIQTVNTTVNSWYPLNLSGAVQEAALTNNDTFVGNVAGSAGMAALTLYNGAPKPQVAFETWPTPFSYQQQSYGYLFGYYNAESGSSVNGSLLPYQSAALHGEYNAVDGSTTWLPAVSHALPASLYLAGRPAWWPASIPFPAVGPDVTGGIGPGGHAYMNPAESVYMNSMGGAEGGPGSPLAFNAQAYYYGNGTVTPGAGPDTTPPVITFTAPANGAAVSGVVTVAGTASDNVGVASVAVSVDGGVYVPVSGSTSWTYSLNTAGLGNGSHTITAKALDAAGNSAITNIVTVTVSNAVGGGVTPGGTGGGSGSGGSGGTGGGTSGASSGSGSPSPQPSGTGTGSQSTSTLAALLQSLIAQFNALLARLDAQLVANFTRTLTVGSSGDDVKDLQVFLNMNGYPVASSGPGSPGSEIMRFGAKTGQALAKWQAANGVVPASGILGPKTRALMRSKWPAP